MTLASVAEGLWQALEPLLPGLSVEVLPSCVSTNTTLLDRARAGDIAPCLLVAESQTQGRGRLGRSWLSVPGASLTFSLALPLAPADWMGLSLAIGVAVAEALDNSGQRIALKWPNDLWLRDAPGAGRKLGGILIETMAAQGQRIAVIGIGINVLPQAGAGLSHGLAALQEIDTEASVTRALRAVALPLVDTLQRFETQGFAPFVPLYAKRDLLLARAVTTTLATVPDGTAEGVDAQGALLVRSGSGALHAITSGEVSVRLARAGACA